MRDCGATGACFAKRARLDFGRASTTGQLSAEHAITRLRAIANALPEIPMIRSTSRRARIAFGLVILALSASLPARAAVLELSEQLGSVEQAPAMEATSALPDAQLELAATDSLRSGRIERLLAKGRAMIGARYVYGRSTEQATDCSGLVGQMFRTAGRMLPRSSREMMSVGHPVAADDIQVGDVVIYRFGQGLHAAVYVGEQRILHASPKHGVVVTALDANWERRMLTARRVI